MIAPRSVRLIFVGFGLLLLALAFLDIYHGRLHGWSGRLWLLRAREPVKFWVASLLLVCLLAGWVIFAAMVT